VNNSSQVLVQQNVIDWAVRYLETLRQLLQRHIIGYSRGSVNFSEG